MTIQNIGVIGAGVMGKGVAQNLAQTNHKVVLIDISEDVLEKATSDITNNLRFQGLFNKDKKVGNFEEIVKNIQFTTDYANLSTVDFVIENVIEKWTIKEQVYHNLEKICQKDCIFACNTSAISITRLASATKRP